MPKGWRSVPLVSSYECTTAAGCDTANYYFIHLQLRGKNETTVAVVSGQAHRAQSYAMQTWGSLHQLVKELGSFSWCGR